MIVLNIDRTRKVARGGDPKKVGDLGDLGDLPHHFWQSALPIWQSLVPARPFVGFPYNPPSTGGDVHGRRTRTDVRGDGPGPAPAAAGPAGDRHPGDDEHVREL